MLSDEGSDAPEEVTAEQGIKQDEQIRKIQRENKMRVAQEGKERRRKWAQRNTQAKLQEDVAEAPELEEEDDPPAIPGMLPSNIVNFLAAREKQTLALDSEQEAVNDKPAKQKKKKKETGPETVLLKDIPPSQCLENSMEFLKRRKMNVSRSNSVLKNANQALRFLSSKGNLLSLS
ncbi:hypothetical protein AXF42_Ash005442 [Apostasia shenzhenica]|uniref:Uncharacterized protein n=1 Tax=Apostasia shenzhenica TaxID=1088818 RepID=A0A2I0B6X1_9ASPA|nr:hypothetical protein AXF42_Ash005442 [Apostasia shenzhenica]